jgi:hypothetical protein
MSSVSAHPAGFITVKERPKTRIDEQLERSAANAAKREKKPPAPHQFQPGNVPVRAAHTSRGRLQRKFLDALADDFEMHGKRAIERARIQDPMGYVKAVVALMPKQFEQTTPLQDLSDSELEQGIAFLKSKLAVGTGARDRTPPLLIEADGLQAVPETD